MVTKTKIFGFILATAVMLSSPMMVYADNGMGDKEGHQDGAWHHGPPDQMFAKVLNLSDDQVKQLKDLHQKQKDDMKAVFEQMKSTKEELNAEIIKATPDMNKINDLQTKLKGFMSQMVDNHLNSILAIKKIMTPEQFAGYIALRKERKMMMHGKHDHFGPKEKSCKMGDEHKHGGDKDDDGDRGHSSDEQE